MNYDFKSKIDCSFQLTENVMLEVKPYIEVSFPCSNCKRDHRTVIFRNIGARGICTPKTKCVGFPGTLKSLVLSDTESGKSACFVIEYNYTDFIDTKYQRNTQNGATWTRIHYIITCPKCIETTESTTQTNIIRPIKRVCNCGNVLYHEPDNPINIENT